MRDRFPVMLAGGLALLGVVAFFLFAEARRGSFAGALSTYSSEPEGARALFLLATESGLELDRWREPLEALPPEDALVLLGAGFERAESKPPLPRILGKKPREEKGTPEEVDRPEGVSPEDLTSLLDRVYEGARVLVLVDAQAEPLLVSLSSRLVPLPASAHPDGRRTLVPGAPSPYTRGVTALEVPIAGELELPPSAVPLLLDSERGTVVGGLFPWGLGELVVIAAPGLARNDALTRSDNARFWLTALAALPNGRSGRTWVDEVHHGFGEGRSVARFARRYGLPFAIGQLLLGLVLWAASLRRFGRMAPPVEERRVTSVDALSASARLYREGKHHRPAAKLLVRSLTADLGRLAAVPPGSDRRSVLAALRRQGRDEVAANLEELDRLEDRTHTDLQLQALATLATSTRVHLRKKHPSPTGRT